MIQSPELSTKKHSAKETKKVRLAFLGVGWIGRNRMEGLAKSRHVEVCGIADASSENLSAAMSAAPGATPYASFEELLESDADGIVIATPSALHAQQSIQALKKGKAVFCQKPLARDTAETRAVIEVARERDLLLGVDLSYRHTCFRKLYDIVQGGALGDIYAVELVFHNAWGPDKNWFYDPKLSGGGCVIDLGIHLIDLALWTLDKPKVRDVQSNLFAGGKPLANPAEQVEDYATALMKLEMENGRESSLQLSCSWNLPAGQEADIQANFYGTQGGLAFRNMNGSFYDFRALQFNSTNTEVLFEGQDDWGARAAINWAEKLAAGEKYNPEVEILLEVANVLDQIYGK